MLNLWILLVVVYVGATACAPASHVIRGGMDNLVPMAAQATEPMPVLGKRPAPKAQKKADKKPEKKDEKPTGTQQEKTVDSQQATPADKTDKVDKADKTDKVDAKEGTGAASNAIIVTEPAKDFEPKSGKASMVPASGDVRKRLVRSASRLVGIKKSFDDRSFLGHVLAINDLLPKGASSVAWTADDQIKVGRKAGRFKTDSSKPATGDIVFFKCAGACGADSADGIGAGVVVEDKSGNEAFVAYRKGTVERVTGETEFTGYMEP